MPRFDFNLGTRFNLRNKLCCAEAPSAGALHSNRFRPEHARKTIPWINNMSQFG
ncbi:hypothetical protein ACU8KH_01242 [Lachancea thermotolerans]